MSQPSQPEQNGAQPSPDPLPGAGVTAVLDSMIRTTDRRERVTERPLKAKQDQPARGPTAVDEREVKPTSATPKPTPTPTPNPTGAKDAGTSADTPTTGQERRMPAPAIRIRFTDFADMGRPMWSVAGATALGLPARFLEAFDQLKDGDEAGWISTLVKLVVPLCTGAEDRSTILVAGEAAPLPQALGLPVHRPGALPPYGGSIYCMVDDSEVHFEWLDRVRGDRDLHLVLNGTNTDWLAYDQPTAVSYTTNRGALEALKLADATGAGIAFGVNADEVPIRATALELVMSIRALFRIR